MTCPTPLRNGVTVVSLSRSVSQVQQLSTASAMASSQHYIWAGGHFVLLFASLYCLYSTIFFRKIAFAWWYKTAFTGGLISYGIVCFKALGTPQVNGLFLRRAFTDENVQYLLLALMWWASKPVVLALAPYAIFSLFHSLTFSRTTILPLIFPPTPAPAGSSAPPQPSPYSKRIQAWVRANYDPAMRVVAFTELAIMARLIIGILLRRNSFGAPIFFAHFLRQRYFHSAFTREATKKVTQIIDTQLLPRAPPVVGTVWAHLKDLLARWAGSTLTEQNQQSQQQSPARG